MSDVYHRILEIAPYVMIPLIVLGSAIFYGIVRWPTRLVMTILILVVAFVVSMPTGTDAAKTVWDQKTFSKKVDCAAKLGQDLGYWNWEKDPTRACK